MTVGFGLRAKRQRTCPCGVVFTTTKATARYCADCRKTAPRYGRTYGPGEPRPMKVYR